VRGRAERHGWAGDDPTGASGACRHGDGQDGDGLPGGGHDSGQRGPAEHDAGALDRAHRRRGDPELLAPPAVEPPQADEPVVCRVQAYEPEGLGKAELVGEESGQLARAAVG
jgi:hypothetical protein